MLQKTGDIFFDYGAEVSAVIAAAIFGFLIYRARTRSTRVYKIIFDDSSKLLKLICGNTFTGRDTNKMISYSCLRIAIHVKPVFGDLSLVTGKNILNDDKLSQNGKLMLYNNTKLVSTIDIDLTPWCRHIHINDILKKLQQIADNNTTPS